ncbi:NADH-quinone oxidoreductase subunit J [Gilliamella sp.]|uniref:NADH-quinone oxidoreductase subunit J family protein n=1 Tax=unclassified Gilliamella TaxID=2685620 RepID=UPI0025DC17A1|nr:NADH-quinone oxidoreductase subunit J [Gilliamella sp.]MCO6545973.1 NADH-quinone oxidoreductase subunit J [Gilliamella sp.]MCO6550186.1 NADH-quinone oxidoreductase subunit J [Gilliamella sp.]MCO6553940.1 NADH-quinone oxidoreductase subunit J [Gilliamella sp.]MCO6555607.1 NADH-quinone oxidoreductase subunit J [Gilliamella sp.]
MIAVFYIASIIAVVASIKVISSLRVDKAILYLVISLFASALIFILLNTYYSAILYILLFIGGSVTIFLLVASILKIKDDNVENHKQGISPKIWLGPLVLAFVLLVALIYSVVSTDYSELKESHELMHEMSKYAYILIAELALFLLLGAVVIAYHFMHRLMLEK